MASLVDFLHDLLSDGRAVLRGRPFDPVDDRAGASAVLESAFADHRLDVAGLPIAFDGPSAMAAAGLVRLACWFLVSRSEPVDELDRRLAIPRPPRTASEHLSADLTFRFLPQIHRRARALAPGDRLPAILADVLRAWPLSGVLSDVEDGPAGSADLAFGGHPGLQLLYAERLARHEKPAWMPDGPAMEQVERVFLGLGRPRPSPRRRAHERDEVTLGG